MQKGLRILQLNPRVADVLSRPWVQWLVDVLSICWAMVLGEEPQGEKEMCNTTSDKKKTIWRSLLLNQENLNLNARDLFLSLLLSTFLSLNCYQFCPLYQTHHHIIIKVGAVLVIPVYDEVHAAITVYAKEKLLNFQTPTGSWVHHKLILFQSVGQCHIKYPGKKGEHPIC